MSIKSAIQECALKILERGPATVDDIVRCAYVDHPEIFAEEADRLARDAARSIAKSILRKWSDDDEDGHGGQLSLPGLRLPSAIAVPGEGGGYVYIRADQAVWGQLVAGRSVRRQNVTRAQIKLDHYDESCERLRPWMEYEPGCTVADALRRERGES